MRSVLVRYGLPVAVSISALLTACGGGGSSGGAIAPLPPVPEKTSTELAQICAADNHLVNDPAVVTKIGSLADERNWVRAYLQERYLWYPDIQVLNPLADRYNVLNDQGQLNVVSSLANYFLDQLTAKNTASGSRVDKFSFMAYTDAWNKFSAGEEFGYGWLLQNEGSGASRKIRVLHVFPTTTPGLAGAAGVQRGDEVISIDGVQATVETDASVFNALLSPSVAGEHRVLLSRNGVPVTVQLAASTAVLPQASHKILAVDGVRWGYLLFNGHVASAQTPLLSALRDFKTQGIDELVVDLRYNGGGYLNMASALAYGVAGQARTQDKVFEMLRYNDKRSQLNERMPFVSTDMEGRPIDGLGLSKIYVLTTDATCSASESFINGLRGVDVDVVQIGGTSCGKPYGFVPQDNCGLTYAAMEFDGVNDKGQGGYVDGLVPQCAAHDDLAHELGDPAEAMFAVAIARQQGRSCTPASSVRALGSQTLPGLTKHQPQLMRSPWQSSKVIRAGR